MSEISTFWVIPPEITWRPQVENDPKMAWGAATWLHLRHFFGFFPCNIVDAVKDYYPTSKVVELDTLTEGAACSVLTADTYLNDNDSVFLSGITYIFD